MHKKKNRPEEKTASMRTKTEQKRELRNLKCSLLGQNNHGYQMPFVVNRRFSVVRFYTGTNTRCGPCAVPCKTLPHGCPRGTSLIIKNWLVMWKSGESNIKLAIRKIDGVLCIIFFVWINPKLGSWPLARCCFPVCELCGCFSATPLEPSLGSTAKQRDLCLGVSVAHTHRILFDFQGLRYCVS